MQIREKGTYMQAINIESRKQVDWKESSIVTFSRKN